MTGTAPKERRSPPRTARHPPRTHRTADTSPRGIYTPWPALRYMAGKPQAVLALRCPGRSWRSAQSRQSRRIDFALGAPSRTTTARGPGRTNLAPERRAGWFPCDAPGWLRGMGSAGRDDYQAHGLVLGSFRGHRQHDPPAPGVDVVSAGRDRGVDGAYPVFERAVEAGVAAEVDRGCAGGLGVRPADADEDAGSLVRPEPGACRIRRLADRGGRVRRAVRWGAVVVERHHLVAGGPHRRRRGRRRFRYGHGSAARSVVRIVPSGQGEAGAHRE